MTHTPETLAAQLADAGDTNWVHGVLGTSESDTEIGYIRTSGQNMVEVLTGNPDIALVAHSGARPLMAAAPTLATELSAALVREKALREALIGMINHYTELVNCGDCGNWDPETDDPVIHARAALAQEDQG